MFDFDVVLSFAGEQRKHVEDVARILKANGVRVFYDEDERADLWGKNLYDHLSTTYRDRARHCIMFVSKAYAEKEWTSLERQSAQARALQDSSVDYILPVRFDDTDIPGVLRTVGYLNFHKVGVDGICADVLKKLGKSMVVATAVTEPTIECSTSSRALIQLVASEGAVVPVVQSCTWGNEVEMVVADDGGDVLAKLRNSDRQCVVAYNTDVALARPISVARTQRGGSVTWVLKFAPQRENFSDPMETGTTGTTADQFAELRARRILLNEEEYSEDADSPVLDRANRAMREVLLEGVNSLIKVKQSKIPQIFRAFPGEPHKFLETAWILSVADLKLSGAVETIELLHFSLSGSRLKVSFSGVRHRIYSNRDPYEVEISGELMLPSEG